MAKIVIECLPVSEAPVALPPGADPQHLYLVFIDDDGNEQVIRGDGPTGIIETQAGIPLSESKDARGTATPEERNQADVELMGRDPGEVWATMVEHAKAIAAAEVPYRFYENAQNSNSVVSSSLNSVGIDIDLNMPAGKNNDQGHFTGIENKIDAVTPPAVNWTFQMTDDIRLLRAGAGNDTITGTEGNDSIYGGEGSDSVFAGLGHDLLDLTGTTAANILNGGNNADTILGGAGGDELRGGKGLDSIVGGAGDDTIFSGLGKDTLTGGDGADIFVLRGFDARYPGAVLEPTVTDFETGVDQIAIQGVSEAEIAAALLEQETVDGNVQFTIVGATVTVMGVSSLTTDNVIVADFV
ncbi:calcium-binding protein [Oceanibaculum nanhaiense]|uniref:calcium-binding protein n=1 Tax=Oceanibaculum nanhaiense TaxID=1909734 RepID=UPI000A38E1A8|nr:calcium-binding protein [Oceanibaculum nanhaiense]MBC7136385.1 calcium-binding protein [Oceanibaculum nanhaiense]